MCDIIKDIFENEAYQKYTKYLSDDFICCNYLWLTSSIDILKINGVYIKTFSLIYALSNKNLDQAYLDTLHNKNIMQHGKN